MAADRQIFARIIAVALDLLMPLSVIGVIRILPVPYKLWVVVGFIFVWRLLCDLTVFNFGKFFADLSVVSAKGGTCAPWQVATRQAPHAMAQAACTLGFLDLTAKGLGWQVLLDPISVPWPAFAQSNSFAPVLMLSALVYALVSLACAGISTEGRRIEDFIFGTRVIRSRRR